MNIKEHYDSHLAAFYAWMAGDYDQGVSAFAEFLVKHAIPKGDGRTAIDLGSGHGLQSVALARHGFKVKAIDFTSALLDELSTRKGDLEIEVINDDLRDFKKHCREAPSLVCCWGDTLTHLSSLREVEDLLGRVAHALQPGGYLILSFRDYTIELKDNARFIPVRSDEKRILTCMLEYFPMYVKVSDLYQEFKDGQWQTKVSSYLKLRLEPSEVMDLLEENDLDVKYSGTDGGVLKIVAVKK